MISRGLEVEHLGYAVGYHSSSSWPSLSKIRNNINILIKFHYHDLHFFGGARTLPLEVVGHQTFQLFTFCKHLPNISNACQQSVETHGKPLLSENWTPSEVCLSENLGFIPHKQVSVVYSQTSPS